MSTTTTTPTTMAPAMRYHAPVVPYGIIDAVNRRAAAVGSPRYAALAGDADYNGHSVSLAWNEYRGYYVAEFWWAGRHVLARGSFERCLEAALAEYRRGALGSSLHVRLREGDGAAATLCEATPELQPGPAPRSLDWLTWRHQTAAGTVRDYANPGRIVLRFDLELLQAADSERDYIEALRAKYGTPLQ